MSENLDKLDKNPEELAIQYQDAIKNIVSTTYRINIDNLTVETDKAFSHPSLPDTLFCKVWDGTGLPYGVCVTLNEQGDPIEYRCQRLF